MRRFIMLVVLSALLAACGDGLPEPSTPEYREAVSGFYAGLAGIQTGANRLAEEKLVRVTEVAPGEPAAWVNLGLLAVRENRFGDASEYLDRARALAPESAEVAYLLSVLHRKQGETAAAVEHLREAVALDSTAYRAAYALMQDLDREGRREEARLMLGNLLRLQPANLALLVEDARLAAADGDAVRLREAISRLTAEANDWPAELDERLAALREAAARADFQQALQQVAYLENMLLRLPVYRVDLSTLQDAPGQEGALLTQFLRLPTPNTTPAKPDTAMSFRDDALVIDDGPWTWVGALPLAGTDVVTLAVANAQALKLGTGTTLPFPGEPRPFSRHVVAAFDYDNDYQMDVALAGRGGLRLYRQEGGGSFADVTERLELPDQLIEADLSGVWAADLDLEGDLDLVIASGPGMPKALRNNGDGTFTSWTLFEGIGPIVDFVWADLDADGDPDAALLEADGEVHLFTNERVGRFEPASSASGVQAIAAADLDNDSRLELLQLDDDGTLWSRSPGGQREQVARWPVRTSRSDLAALYAADMDNNGALDVLASTSSGSLLWLQDDTGELRPTEVPVSTLIYDMADLGGAGRLDLLSLSADGQPVHHVNQGTRNYASKTIQLRAAQTTGDRRINSFGIGGTVEVRSGLLYQKQRITEPVVHFGLGENDLVDVARIIWPNGTVQAEFDLETNQTVLAQQRLKGSCPWVFTNDGSGIRFVTDFLWRTALGLRINAQEGTNVMHGVDWIKIESDELRPVSGVYDIRITADLWETHFFDEVALMTLDHPVGTNVLVDERFALPAPEWKLHTVDRLRPVTEARDEAGNDVQELVRALDGKYLDTFDLGAYQGVAQEHYVEVALGPDATQGDSTVLVASGWVRPTDSSINFAIAQGRQTAPFGLQLDVPDGQGGWRTVRPDIGFPAGKTKTMVIDLTGVLGRERRVRLRTNMEIYWDRIAWATRREDADLRTQRLTASSADLRYRGFSAVRQAGHSSPELPVYDTLAATAPQWIDLEGYYTRFGDVRELVGSTDDRYVIMNAGDELSLTFAAPPPPPEGWERDFVLIGDGWVKDGDFNTGFSRTVRPLPFHGLEDYSIPPSRLEDDPAYRSHPGDWRRFHTRYVAPTAFHHALVPPPSSAH